MAWNVYTRTLSCCWGSFFKGFPCDILPVICDMCVLWQVCDFLHLCDLPTYSVIVVCPILCVIVVCPIFVCDCCMSHFCVWLLCASWSAFVCPVKLIIVCPIHVCAHKYTYQQYNKVDLDTSEWEAESIRKHALIIISLLTVFQKNEGLLPKGKFWSTHSTTNGT
jgi:hypothetical protein